jgi:sarcosine oxidase subunit gamma
VLARIAAASRGTVSAAAMDDMTQISLRLRPSSVAHLPFDVPEEPNTVSSTDGLDAIWLGPDEWLLVALRPPDDVLSELAGALERTHHALVDVSANRVIVQLSGARRHELLSTGVPVDLHPRSWRPGRCAQTLFGRAQVLLHEREGTTRVFVRPSFGGYVAARLADAAATALTT